MTGGTDPGAERPPRPRPIMGGADPEGDAARPGHAEGGPPEHDPFDVGEYLRRFRARVPTPNRFSRDLRD